ncbi:hypothetical protein [Sinorhizobium sp. CCBAU 05631]|uniref:hypothetical protein n=1 Tax=Sinorhizobium sp. CCBAU 05631 TaxID=794846 RepID=UPI0004B843A9|nr:hypothetical protein [Sinorhizobium sp. CCBAU 05631]ASY60192.1 hypothetical protein SS05631_b61000 [Sinorhizobium sp. CCBAU 05631]
MQVLKTVEEMNVRELADLMSAVADALEAAADEAEEDGDARAVANSMSLACSLRGCSSGLEACDLKAAELLLEQGITFVHLLNSRKIDPAALQ